MNRQIENANQPSIVDVRNMLTGALGTNEPLCALTESTRLLGALPGLDSITIVNVILAMEEEFEITINDDDIEASDFDSVGTLLVFIRDKIAGIR